MAAAALLLLAAGLFFFASRSRRPSSLGEFADLHVATLASANPVEVVSTDRHTVKPWFQGRIPFTFDLPDLQGSPFTLTGGRVAYFHQEPGAHLIFSYQRHFISAFIFRDTPQLAISQSSFSDREHFLQPANVDAGRPTLRSGQRRQRGHAETTGRFAPAPFWEELNCR